MRDNMIYVIGIDLVELERIKFIGIDCFKDKILNEDEKNEYVKINYENRKLIYLVGRFVVKEFLFKCFKVGDKMVNYKDFLVLNDNVGVLYVLFKYIIDFVVYIIISYINFYVIVFVVLEIKV